MARPKKGRASSEAGSIATRLVERLDKKYGEGSAVVLSGDLISAPTDFISTQIPTLDAALGMPGVPVGRITAIIGETSTGKTTLAYHILAETQRRNGIAILIDAERALDPHHAARLGIDPDNLVVLQPNTVEEACSQMMEALDMVREEYPGVLTTIVFDSIAGIPTEAEEKAEFDSASVGTHARVVGKALRKINTTIAKDRVALILVNQYRDKIGFSPVPGMQQKTMIAARPINFFASLKLEVTKVKDIAGKKKPIGILGRVKAEKNKVAGHGGVAMFSLYFDRGFDMDAGFLELALDAELVSKSGAWYTGPDGQKFQESKWSSYLAARPDLRAQIMASLGFEYPPESKMMAATVATVTEDPVDEEEEEDEEEEDDD